MATIYVISTDLPKYINDVLHVPLLKNGIFSSLPSVAGIFASVSTGWLCDWMIGKKNISVTMTRKIFVFLGKYIRRYLL